MKKYLAAAIGFVLLTLVTVFPACQSPPATTPVARTAPELEYSLFAQYPDVFWCDPDFYPVSRGPTAEQDNALAQFAAIQANAVEFAAILEHLNLPAATSFTDEQKLAIYRQHKMLTYAAQLTPASNTVYNFTLRTGKGQGLAIQGTISTSAQITVLTQTSSFNTCPICLTAGTLIDTPLGPVPVEKLGRGAPVWTLDESGRRVPGTIIETAMVQAPPGFEVATIVLGDGRQVSASQGHPTADGRPIGDLKAGDILDGAQVVSAGRTVYSGFTYDILPSGETGLYRANGILLGSTLK